VGVIRLNALVIAVLRAPHQMEMAQGQGLMSGFIDLDDLMVQPILMPKESSIMSARKPLLRFAVS